MTEDPEDGHGHAVPVVNGAWPTAFCLVLVGLADRPFLSLSRVDASMVGIRRALGLRIPPLVSVGRGVVVRPAYAAQLGFTAQPRRPLLFITSGKKE